MVRRTDLPAGFARPAAEDDTVVLPRPKQKPPERRRGPMAIAATALAAAAAIAAWVAWHAREAEAPASLQPATALPLADEAAIDAETPTSLVLHRFAPNARILIFDFADLREQGLMFNRVAAFAEKAGLPHDRLLSDTELARAVSAGGDTTENYYYGHDYDSETISRFFAIADRDHVVLNAQEQQLRAIAAAQGVLADNAGQAIITLAREGADIHVDRVFRATTLHHELSHGAYFTQPDYARYVRSFWRDTMNDTARGAFTRFLVEQEYDPALQDLLINETQAYLMYTPDPRAFSAAIVGLPPAEIGRLRAVFWRGMPAGWLRDSTNVAGLP